MSKLIDLSYIIENEMPVYPGDTKTSIIQTQSLVNNGYSNHKLVTGMHAGTHIDTPMHLTASPDYMHQFPLDIFVGKGCIIDVRNQASIKMKPEYEETVEEGCILLLYTGFNILYGTKEYYQSHPCIDMDFCSFIVKKKIKMLGVDMPSPDRYPFELHKKLFDNRVLIIENLTNLEEILNVKEFEVIALPLKIKADSSITRAVARIL